MRRPLRLLTLLACLALLGACSRFDLAYRNLDWLLAWRIDCYLDLNAEQKAWLEPRLDQHLTWHCSTQLPQLTRWLDQDRATLAAGELDAPQLRARLGELRAALEQIPGEVSPTVAGLLQQLSPLQVQQLRKQMARENAELRREFVAPPLEQQIALRAENTEKRLQPWFGELNAAQRALVRSWAEQRGEQNTFGWTAASAGRQRCCRSWRAAAVPTSPRASSACYANGRATGVMPTGSRSSRAKATWPSCSAN